MLSKITRQSRQLNNAFAKSISYFNHVEQAPADPILGVNEQFVKCDNSKKVNLVVGAYRGNDGKPWILPSVREAQKRIFDQNLDHEYLPPHGLQSFIDASLKLGYGEDNAALKEGRIAGIQSLSGTGCLFVGFSFIKKYMPQMHMLFPDPTWPNHISIAQELNAPNSLYRYYDKSTKGLNLQGMLEDLDKAPNKSLVCLHATAHNPTGVDPTPAQWSQIKDLVQQKEHLAFFDMAYQGFTSGSIEVDSLALREFVKGEKIPIFLAQSYAKNFGLYGQRIGCMSLICDSVQEKSNVVSQLKQIARRVYSSPPKHGAQIVSQVLNDDGLHNMWLGEIQQMSTRITSMRSALVEGLKDVGSVHDWSHITNQIGMFAYTGLNPEMVKELREKHHVYLVNSGRISIAGLNTGNVKYVAEAFHNVTKGKQL